jgi:hypothetical protein
MAYSLRLPTAHAASTAGLLRLVGLIRPLAIAACLLLAVVCATVNLPYAPMTWFDEGSHLHVPKTLVQFGVYADRGSDGFRYFGPTTGVGPTVLLPIAGVFKVAGIGLLQARLVMAAYLIAALVVFAITVRHLHGEKVALLATLLLLSAPGINLLYLGRQVLGEVPALAFLMLGLLLWLKSTEQIDGGRRLLLGASLCFALTALTKSQFTLILAPTFALLFLANLVYYRALRPWHTVLPFLCVGAGAVAGQVGPLLPLIGTDELSRTLALAREASGGAIFVFSPSRVLSSLKFLLGADLMGAWVLPGLIYGLALARPRSLQGARHGLLAIFACVGLGWFAFASIGWPRYAFPGLAVAAIFAARLLVDLLGSIKPISWKPHLATARYVALAALIVLLPGTALVEQLRTVAATPDSSPQRMAAYLNATVPLTDIVEGWEPELGFLTDHPYHYPSSGWLDRAVRARWLGGAPGSLEYDPLAEAKASYLVVGKFGKYAGVYESFLKRERPELVTSIGEYDLYRLEEQPR